MKDGRCVIFWNFVIERPLFFAIFLRCFENFYLG